MWLWPYLVEHFAAMSRTCFIFWELVVQGALKNNKSMADHSENGGEPK